MSAALSFAMPTKFDLPALARDAVEDEAARLTLHDFYEEKAATEVDRRLVLAAAYEPARPDIARILRDELPPPAKKTRKRVEKMTAAESAKMKAWSERWIKIGLSTDRADRALFEAAVNACYRMTPDPAKPGAFLAPPKRIVWAPNPLVVALAGPFADLLLRRSSDAVRGAVGDAVRGAVRDAVGDAVDDAVRGAVGDAVGGAVSDAVSDAVGDAVRGAVGDAVRGAVGDAVGGAVSDAVSDAVGGAVRDAVGDAVDDAVGGAVRDAVGGAVGDAVRDAVGGVSDRKLVADLRAHALSNYYRYLGGQFWVGWWWDSAATMFFIDELRLDVGRDIELRARAYAATAMAACWWWPHRDFVVVSERPHTIEKYADGRLKRCAWEGWEVTA